ncbi:VOC family protein [Sphingomicrobium flavum]|uniref:VOC family protein n=1 Tax=Sphingomicrobium flavum TaxID=1229164 RepID=UPI0021AE1B47|nr:VOC family protein [Sphingomicrobium flavum]
MGQKLRTVLWFDGGLDEAADFYVGTFPDSSRKAAIAAPMDFPSGDEGDPLVLDLVICGRDFQLLNGGDAGFAPNMATSFMVETEDQEDTDRIWDAILAAGGKAVQCGWITDPYGYSWQVIPRLLNETLAGGGTAAKRAFEAMMPMVKIDVATIEAAIHGGR